MNSNHLKQSAAAAAMDSILPHLEKDMIIGIGTGSTIQFFIDQLNQYKYEFKGCVSSSEQTTKHLKAHGIEVYDLNSVSTLRFYIDGTDEVNKHLHLVKGGGAALTREKIIAAVAQEFICIADASKAVGVLGKFPLPIEVIPMARSYVGRELVKLGGDPAYREGIVTDNGNVILDVWNMKITDPIELETKINSIVGVVSNGLFAIRKADVLLLASQDGIKKYQKTHLNEQTSIPEFQN